MENASVLNHLKLITMHCTEKNKQAIIKYLIYIIFIYMHNIFRMITVRGLCEASIFDTNYFYNIDENGDTIYYGELSSFLIFDQVTYII